MKCPGQDSRFWGKDAIFEARCPQCGAAVEFFKDEPSRRCASCGHKFVNPRMDFGCAAYCKYANQCLGELPPELIAKRENLLKDRIAIEAKKKYGRNFAAISRAVKATRFAEELLKTEEGDPAIVIMAAHLHMLPSDHGSKNPTPNESAQAAEELLNSLSSNEELNRNVVALIRNRTASPDLSDRNHMLFHDALALADFEESIKKNPKAGQDIPKLFTSTARKLADEIRSLYGGNS